MKTKTVTNALRTLGKKMVEVEKLYEVLFEALCLDCAFRREIKENDKYDTVYLGKYQCAHEDRQDNVIWLCEYADCILLVNRFNR